MDLAPVAAIVKKNKRLGERPSQEFNVPDGKRGKTHKTNAAVAAEQQSGLGAVEAGEKGELIRRQIDLFSHLVLQIRPVSFCNNFSQQAARVHLHSEAGNKTNTPR